MQVKCCYEQERMVRRIRSLGDDLRDKDTEWSTSLRTFSNGHGIPIYRSSDYDLSELYILGGRKSIIDWLKPQSTPVYAQDPVKTLYLYLLRKTRVFDKNLSLVLISPTIADKVRGCLANSSWEVRADAQSLTPVMTPQNLAEFVQACMDRN
jgi:hypothetical protein